MGTGSQGDANAHARGGISTRLARDVWMAPVHSRVNLIEVLQVPSAAFALRTRHRRTVAEHMSSPSG